MGVCCLENLYNQFFFSEHFVFPSFALWQAMVKIITAYLSVSVDHIFKGNCLDKGVYISILANSVNLPMKMLCEMWEEETFPLPSWVK